jgi:hypothetical protein
MSSHTHLSSSSCFNQLHNTHIEPPANFQRPVYILRDHKNASIQQKAIDFVPTTASHQFPQSEPSTSLDPRLFDSPRSQRLILDVPPWQTQGTQPLTDMYAVTGGNRTGYYPDYEKITGGQIYYYNDIDSDLPYTTPPFSIPVHVVPQVLIDPMGGQKFYYDRIPLLSKQNNQFEYSFDQDQCEYREDLMAKQQQIFYTNAFGAYQFFQDRKKYYPMVAPPTKGQKDYY